MKQIILPKVLYFHLSIFRPGGHEHDYELPKLVHHRTTIEQSRLDIRHSAYLLLYQERHQSPAQCHLRAVSEVRPGDGSVAAGAGEAAPGEYPQQSAQSRTMECRGTVAGE